MSRARGQSGPTISLFPFLAVLLCTMGSLLVVLVIFSRSAKQAGEAAAEASRQQAAAARQTEQEELELAREELGWRIEQLREVRDRTAAELAKARMQLAGTEEDSRKLADEFEALGRTAEALENTSGDDAAKEAILDLERRLAESKKALEEAEDDLAAKPPAYAVVPYEGKNGTHRRPLYIECCIDGVFLQPEGIRLGPGDFEGPPGPGNPLASALRAAREHIARSPGESGDPDVQPYPLLLVRPSGVMAYYAARESIQSWGSEFGYQFIDEEWTMNYPPRDPALAEAEIRAVEEARRRLEWLAQVRPVKASKPATQYRAASGRGGVVSSSGPSVLGDQSRFDWTEDQAGGGQGAPGRGFNAGTAGSIGGDGGLGGGDTGGGDAILGNRGTAGTRGPGGQGTGGAGGPGSGPDGGPAAGDYAAVGSRYSGPAKFYAGSGSEAASAGGGTGTDGGSRSGGPGSAGQGSAGHGTSATGQGTAAGGQAAGAASAGASSGGSSAGGSSGGAEGSGGGATTMAGSSSGAGSGGGGSGPSMPGLHQSGGGASAGGMSGASAGGSASLAGKRGSNWASLATNDNPVPLTRPIKLECAADEFRILGDGGRVESRIPIGTRTVDSIDPLVREVHGAVGRWGLAGDRMYWKPELVLSATPTGAGRRDDLEKLLADSGIDTRRSETRDKIRNLPPVQRTGGIFPRR